MLKKVKKKKPQKKKNKKCVHLKIEELITYFEELSKETKEVIKMEIKEAQENNER